MPRASGNDSASGSSIEEEKRRLELVELAKEKLKKYKLSCTRLEAKKGLEPLKTVDGKPVQNAILFNQWEKQLVNWMKTVNIYWAVNPNTSEEKKSKHAKDYKKALETLYICLESAVVDHVAKAEVQDERNQENGAAALIRLRSYFQREKDEINLESVEEEFRACKPSKGETIEAWLLRIRQFEVLLANTERKKTDSEVLTIIKRNLPKEFSEFKLKYAMKEGVQRDAYVKALKKWAQYLQYPKKNVSNASEDAALVSLKAGTPKCEKSVEVCRHCSRSGHPETKCWKLHPELKPKWLKQRDERRRLKGKEAAKGGPVATKEVVQQAHVASGAESAKWNISLCADMSPESPEYPAEWIVDSGSSSHLTPHRYDFAEYIELKETRNISGVNGEVVAAVGVGKVQIPFKDIEGGEGIVTLTNVLHIPEARFRLISVSQLMKKDVQVVFGDEALLKVKDGPTVKLQRQQNLFKFPVQEDVALMVKEASLTRWHARLGHRSKESIQKMVKSQVVDGLVISAESPGCRGPCGTCQQANMRKPAVPKVTKTRADAPNVRVFTDTTGIIKGPDGTALKMFGGTTVFQFFVDDATRRVKVYPMQRKTEDEFLRTLKQYITEVGQPMVILRSDGAAEFQSDECKRFYEEHRIKREITPADTPQYNGVVERAIQSVFRMARAMRLEAQLPIHLAPFAVSYAVSVYNSLPHKALQGHTPNEAWHGKIPDLSKFRIFGCKVWIMTTSKHASKFDNRARLAVFLGFPPNHKGVLCYLPDTHKVVVTHQPVFDEESFPFASEELQEHFGSAEGDTEYMEEDPEFSDAPRLHDFDLELLDELRCIDSIPQRPVLESAEPWIDDRAECGDDIAPDNFKDTGEISGAQSTRYGRVCTPPKPYWIASPAAFAISLAAVESIIKAKDVFEPKSYTEAMQCPDAEEWKQSIQTEVNTLLANNTFEIVDKSSVPEGRRIVKSKWVFKIKCDSQGNFLSRKTRLVAKGFTEIPGVDYFEVFHPVGKGITFRLLCAKAACNNLQLYHVDIKGAFLHATLQEEIYMQLPEGTGFENGSSPCVVKLKKSLYGLKQAGRDWYCAHSQVLQNLGFQRSLVDPCLFFQPEHRMWLHMYVDDDLIAVKTKEDFDWLVTELSKHFEVGSATLAEHYLGIRIQQHSGVVRLDQQASVEDLIAKYGLADAKAVTTPSIPNHRLPKLKDDEEVTQEPYRSLVGALLYISMHTRPDIVYAVGELARHCSNPGQQHWMAAKRVLRYLQGTKSRGLEFQGCKGMLLSAAADSDWAGGWKDDTLGTKSTSGYVVTIAGSVVVAKSKMQSTTALSSCEAEYISLALAAQEIVHCRQLLCDLQEEQMQPTILLCDNVAAGELCKSETHQQRSKHIAIRYHFIRECVKRGEILVKWCSGQDNVADMFTKPLGRVLFQRHAAKLLGYM